MSKLLQKKTRQISAATLIVSAVILLSFIFVDHSRSANPAAKTLSPTGAKVTWDGTATGGASVDESTCVEGVNCDTFTLTLAGTPAQWVGKRAHVVINWTDPTGIGVDYDLFVHKGDNTGPLVGSSAQSGTISEQVDIDPNSPSVGTGVFSVHVVYFTATSANQYSGAASATGGGASPTPTPTPGATPTPTATPPVVAGLPRYQNYVSPPGVADDAGEPSIGVNWNTEKKFSNNRASDGVANPPIPNGGTSLYYGGFLSYMLKITFDDCSSPANALWEQKPVTLPAAPRAAGDPILFTDRGWAAGPGQAASLGTGRTFVSQLIALTPGGSTMEYTDDDGNTFSPSEGGAPSGVDHQTVGGGPFHTPLPPGLVYPNAVYYASQSIADATAELSVDGGITFPLQTPMFTAADCDGLHGHIKIAPDGTAYVPDKGCASAGVPLLNGGEASVIVSEDNNATWNIRSIPGATSSGNDDPSVGVATDSKTIYLGYQADDGHPGIAVSHDKGVTWKHLTDVGAQVGVKNCAFPAVVAGDPDRAAFAFFGSTTGGDGSQPAFPGVWYLYIASTFDGGVTWTTVNATPGDPIQRGGICGSGTCRNLLDFFGAEIDREGRVVIGGEDGCIGSCVNGGPNSFTAKGFITRQSGGKRMYAANDPVEPALPGAPLVGGSINAPPTTVMLSWPEPDNGGSPITAYKVYRAPNAGGPFALLATVPVTNYTDNALLADNHYRVTAVNGIGEGPFCHVFHPVTVELPDPCVLPGVLVISDFNPDGTDKDSGANTPLDPSVNARQLYIAEPFLGNGVNKLVFTLQVAPSTSAPPNSQWFIIWNRKAVAADGSDRIYVAMRSDATGAVSFEYGNFGPPLDPTNPAVNANTPTKLGDADKGTFDPVKGVITITVSNSKLENVAKGNDLAGINVRTYFNRPDPGQRSQNNASDITDDSSYTLRGNASCAIPEIGKLLNISTRELVQTGDNVLIGGFIITGNVSKKVIVRGIGPSLRSNGGPFPGRMADPTLELHDSKNVIASNDNWKDTQRAEIEGTGIPPTNDKESAIVKTLAPGAYTVILRGKNDTTGVAVVEAYDLDATAPSELANISTRGFIQTGDNILIGGFFTGPKTAVHTKVVVRAIGPSIKNQLPNAISDPTLELRDSFGALVATNDNWMDTQKAEIQATGLAPKNNAESAIVKTLTPGQYTAIVRGKDNTTGVGLVEIYHVP
jgi:hypothetical protein